ncbi:putative LRR receptor-like serine/threonine-protein kinase [Dichanthelium oligosanthes]|uniref:Receptor kinase-like protein Xa21 n=1 Tax=Dichanthelium oligosanthes TaxID=888268 RepID=A0A1E5URE5_9POAL|nr:putative LRR receptor-like serine/threonine-protein kinase [Dichanthelium oligosanthes]
MRSKIHRLVLVFLLSTIFLLASCLSAQCNLMDREALIGLKSFIATDPTGALSSWGNVSSACTWTGVLCKHGGRVSELDLQGLNLAGRISPHIGNLSGLISLKLQNNHFVGNLPNQLGRLGQLQMLNLSGNLLTGTIPSAVTNCTNLMTIDLSANSISGGIPSSIHLLQKLRVLKIGKNQIDGSIPPSIGNLSLLNTLDVNTNKLTGNIPEELGRLNHMQYLQLSINNLKGIVPLPLYNLSALSFFAFASNDLYGQLPSDIGFRLPNLRVFHICFNKVHGPIPPSLHNVTKIESIRMSHNLLSSSVPPGLSRLHTLVMYNIGFNKISDTTSIITDLTNCSKLQFIALDENLIEGTFPDSVGNLSSSLEKLYLGGNRISGQIPPSIGRLISLTLLNISYNQLSGSIPSEIVHLKQLTMLGLSGNKLSGPLPVEIGHLTALTTLEISNNELVGRIPEELGHLQRVLSLDISNNNLYGDIPSSLFSLRSLSSILNMSHNSFTGTLIEAIGQLENIIAIDLSNNLLNGSIPLSIGRCRSLQTLSLSRNALTGVIPDTIGNLKGLQSMDLSSNKLTGVIPASLAKLQALQLLNLSMNDLNGSAPSIGIFKNRSAVHLDGNPRLCSSHLTCYNLPNSSSSHHPNLQIVIAVAAALAAAIAILVLILVMFLSRSHLANAKIRATSSLTSGNYPLISYEELCRMTNNFDQTNLIGVGSFGSVYKAVLHDGTPVAIKVLDLHKMGAPKSWVLECEALRIVRHRNLIKLVTICASVDFAGNDFRALIYELVSNGSLEDWIHQLRQHANGNGLNAEEVLNIAIDTASALEYMHNDCGGQVVHCDIKPSNVLLDGDMTAKVGDFGIAQFLAPLQPEQQSISSVQGLKGSIGYIPPEYGYGGKPSPRGDVYSYGVMLLEMITGRSPLEQSFGEDMNLAKWVRENFPHKAHRVIDRRLISTTIDACFEGKHSSSTEQLLLNCLLVPMMEVALSCVVESPFERSSMHDSLMRLTKLKETFLQSRSTILYC